MDTGKKETQSVKIDARILTLRSRNVLSSEGLSALQNDNQYYTFTYYDMIEITEVDLAQNPNEDSTPLLKAYQQMYEENGQGIASGASRQTIVAFTDVADTSQAQNGLAYNKKKIENFWSNTEYPLFFVSMINIRDSCSMEEAINKISETFSGCPHLIYFSFDHSDLFLFFRGNSFQEYAKLLFKLNYSEPSWIKDTITIYSFANNWNNRLRPDKSKLEEFGAVIRIGIISYKQATNWYDHFCTKTKDKYNEDNGKVPQLFWLMGRNDICIDMPRADLYWLWQFIDYLPKGKNCWYTTYDLSIHITPFQLDLEESESPVSTIEDENKEEKFANNVKKLLEKKSASFIENYKEGCEKMKYTEDAVLLRWLRETAFLSGDLLSNRLTVDLGLCLVPQFIDMFDYATKMFSSKKLEIKYMDAVQDCFAVFFKNISVLINSMNQSNHQFIQVPAFHLVSFEMPPKIMAFFTVLIHRYIDLLCDDKNSYGFTVSPVFVDALEVVSIAISELVDHNQYISIGINEKSLYSLYRTSLTLAHEISHFVGETGRCRAKRKGYLLKCILQITIVDLLGKFICDVKKTCDVGEVELRPSDVNSVVEALYKRILEITPKWGEEDNGLRYIKDVNVELTKISDYIYNDPKLSDIIFDFAYENIFLDSEINKCIQKTIYISPERENVSSDNFIVNERKNRFKNVMRKNFLTSCKEYVQTIPMDGSSEEVRASTSEIPTIKHIGNLFRESHADLQAIIMLKPSWHEYTSMLESYRAEDIKIRQLCIARAIGRIDSTYASDLIKEIKEQGNDIKELLETEDSDFETFEAKNINAAVVQYLPQYLYDCAVAMEGYFSSSEESEKREELVKIYNVLRKNGSILELEKELVNFCESYKLKLAELGLV